MIDTFKVNNKFLSIALTPKYCIFFLSIARRLSHIPNIASARDIRVPEQSLFNTGRKYACTNSFRISSTKIVRKNCESVKCRKDKFDLNPTIGKPLTIQIAELTNKNRIHEKEILRLKKEKTDIIDTINQLKNEVLL